MHVIAMPVLVEFREKHPDAKNPLQAWYRTMEGGFFAGFNDLKATFASADCVEGLTVFNAGGEQVPIDHCDPLQPAQGLHQGGSDACRIRPWQLETEEMMGYALKTVPEPQAILRAWMPFKQLVGVTAVRTQEDYAQARATIDALLEEVGDDECHPLADVLDYFADQVKAYEDQHFRIPEAAPSEVLRFLMDQHGLKQDDLGDCAPQSRISDILTGKRSISKEIARRLARRFHVRADLFL